MLGALHRMLSPRHPTLSPSVERSRAAMQRGATLSHVSLARTGKHVVVYTASWRAEERLHGPCIALLATFIAHDVSSHASDRMKIKGVTSLAKFKSLTFCSWNDNLGKEMAARNTLASRSGEAGHRSLGWDSRWRKRKRSTVGCELGK